MCWTPVVNPRRGGAVISRTESSGSDLQYATQRQHFIVGKLRREGHLKATDVARELGVTHETVRKDFIALERRGLLRRVHGGALPVESLSWEPLVTQRTTNTDAKRRIAAAAATYVPTEGAVLLDAGSTTAALAENFPVGPRLTVITNTLPIALSLLGRPNLTVHTLGGRVRATTMAEVDHWALRTLGELQVDVAFLGTNAFSVDHGLSTPDNSEAAVKRAMVAAGRQRILLADHTKFRRSAVFKYAELGDMDVLITDKGLTAKDARSIQSLGVEVLRV